MADHSCLRRFLFAFIACASLQLALTAISPPASGSKVVVLQPLVALAHQPARAVSSDFRFSFADDATRLCNEGRRAPECHGENEAPHPAPGAMASAAAEESDEELIGDAHSIDIPDPAPASVAVASAARVHSLRSYVALERPPRA